MYPKNGMEKSKWQKAGLELLHGNFGNAIKSLSASSHSIEPYAYRNGMFFFGAGCSEKFFSYSGVESSLKAYTQCPELQSIINKKAIAYSNGKLWIMRQGGKGKGKEDTSPYADKCRKLLHKPNPFQSGDQFRALLKIYVDVFGWCMILPIYAGKTFAKYGLSEASAMFLIPPYMLEWRETGHWKSQKNIKDILSEMWLTVGGERTPIDLEQVVIIKDIVPRMYSGTTDGTGGMAELLLFPESRVKAQEQPINNIIATYGSRGELISYAGAQNVISPNPGAGQYVPMAMTPGEQEEMQLKFKMQYGIGARQWRNIISPVALSVQAMGRPTKDLMLFEEVEADVKALCIAWNYPYPLLGYGSSSLNGTEIDAFTRNLYQDTIIPEGASIEQQLSEAFKASENNTIWERDYSHVSAMQADKQKEAEARKILGEAVTNELKANLITVNRALEIMGEDTVTGGDVYYSEWIKTNSNESGQQGADESTATTEES